MIPAEAERNFYRYIGSVCEDKGCELLAIGGTDNHIHLLVGFPSNLTLSDFMERVKGGSSRWMAAYAKEDRAFKWQGGYGAFSVSPHDKSQVIRYIQNQKHRHAINDLWADAEKTSTEEPH